jgi:hypothetical protein
MKTILKPFACLLFLTATTAYAAPTSSSSTNVIRHETEDQFDGDKDVHETEIHQIQAGSQQPGTTTTAPPPQYNYEQTVISEKKPSEGGLRDEAVGINPQFGILSLDNLVDDGQTRAVGGLTVDINVLRRVNTEGGRPFFGPSTGVLYSHLGTATSNFIGTDGTGGRDDGTHLLLIPFNLKAGYTIGDVFRPSVHAGGTLLYNNRPSVPTGIQATTDSTTTVRVNVGLDFEFGLGKSVALMLRPDWIFAEDNTIFVGTLGLVFPIS